MRAFLFATLTCLYFFAAFPSSASVTPPPLKMMNSYVSVKLHLDDNPSRSQMVAAAWIRIRNNTSNPIVKIPYILNPGLHVTKTLGAKNRPLYNTSTIGKIAGYEFLEATTGIISLTSALKPDTDTEIVIHYQGNLQNLSWTGIDHAKETLNPDFTVLRADSFGYPIIAIPEKNAISAALNQPPYYQTATVEIADDYSVAGNLHIDETNLKGPNKAFGLSHAQPSSPMTLPIAKYEKITEGPLAISYFVGHENQASNLSQTLSPAIDNLTKLLGTPSSPKLNITMIPDGYGSRSTSGLVMLEQSKFDAATISSSGVLFKLWDIGRNKIEGHWRNSLDTFIMLSLSGSDLAPKKAEMFTVFRTLHEANKKLGKATLKSLTEAKRNEEASALENMVFAGLHSILGKDQFFQFARLLRSELRGNYADNIVFADFVADELTHKKARKFAKNWLTDKKFGKDMKKAKNFEDIISRYQ